MTWKEIKDKIESMNVKDGDKIVYIEISSDIWTLEDLECIKENGEWRISN